jgi:RHS repeat-associated protein
VGSTGVGGGGGYGTAGNTGPSNAGGGPSYGVPHLEKMYFGSSGGAGGDWNNPNGCGEEHRCIGGQGGTGGGILFITGKTINFSGAFKSEGGNQFCVDACTGGAGSGGSIRIEGHTIINLNAVSVIGGATAAVGGLGRIAIYYTGSFSGFSCSSANSCYSQNVGPTPTATITAKPTITATPTITTTVTPVVSPVNPGTNGLVSWWTLDETSGTRRDSYGTNHLTDNNAVGSAVGLKSNAANFVTANQKFLSIADNPSISGGDIDFTLMANVYLNNSTTTFLIITKSDPTSAAVYDYHLAYVSGTGFRFRVGPQGMPQTPYVDSGPVTAGSWHTVIAWHDSVNNTINIQVDNGTVVSAPYSSGTTDTTYPLTFGANSTGIGSLDGRIDEAALYKRILTPAERAWLYNNGAERVYSEVNPLVNPGTSGLVSWWAMDEASGSRLDSHGTNTLTDNNTVTSASGLKSSAANFVAANLEFLSISDNPSISTGNIDFTLVADVYLNVTNTTMIIANKGDKSFAKDYTLFYDASLNKFALRVGNGSTNTAVWSTNTVSAGQWYTIIAWHDSVNDTLNIQVNNSLVSSLAYAGGATDSTFPLSIGAHADGASALDGRIDEFALYKRVLTANERAWLYNNGAGRSYFDVNPLVNPGTNGLVSWWALDEASGARNDSHGANTLTDNNTVTSASGLKSNAAAFVPANAEYLSVADNAGLSGGDVGFTLVANVYLNSTTNYLVIANKGSANYTDYRLVYNIDVSSFLFRVGNGITNVAVNSSPVVTNTWYTVIAWHDSVNNTINIQINNGPVSSINFTGGTIDTVYPLTIGANSDGTQGLDGRIDEVALYKRVLTAAERTWLYNNGSGRTYMEVGTRSVSSTLQKYIYADPAHAHAVTSLFDPNNSAAVGNSYQYDTNGNMTKRTVDGVTWNLTYNADNRTQSLGNGAYGATYLYDGDGVRVGQVVTTNGTDFETTYYFAGGAYEVIVDAGNHETAKTYYSIGGQMVAMDDGTGLQYFLTDHLGSVSAVVSASGELLSQQRYYPFGEPRTLTSSPLITQTDYGYTGQRANSYIKLLDYRSRWMDPELGRFLQPDSIIPNAANPQSWNRYSYVSNRPILFNDPTGHYQTCGADNDDPCKPHRSPKANTDIDLDDRGKSVRNLYNRFRRHVNDGYETGLTGGGKDPFTLFIAILLSHESDSLWNPEGNKVKTGWGVDSNGVPIGAAKLFSDAANHWLWGLVNDTYHHSFSDLSPSGQMNAVFNWLGTMESVEKVVNASNGVLLNQDTRQFESDSQYSNLPTDARLIKALNPSGYNSELYGIASVALSHPTTGYWTWGNLEPGQKKPDNAVFTFGNFVILNGYRHP